MHIPSQLFGSVLVRKSIYTGQLNDAIGLNFLVRKAGFYLLMKIFTSQIFILFLT
jgi:hypothetical protein